MQKIASLWLLLCLSHFSIAQQAPHPTTGVQIITSGGKAAEKLFIDLLGGPDVKVVFIPTAASSLRSESGVIWNPDEETNKKEFRDELMKRFKLNQITLLHTRNQQEANSKNFVAPLREAKAVWILGGNAGRLMAVYKGTLLEKALRSFLNRGGIVAGESAGAIVQGSYTIRGNPDKPVLMVKRKRVCPYQRCRVQSSFISSKKEKRIGNDHRQTPNTHWSWYR